MDYKVFQNQYIVDNKQHFVEQCLQVKESFKDKDTTWSYHEYNIFSLTAGSVYFYNLFKDLKNIIITELPDQMLWMQAWVNVHKNDSVLDWHNHQWDYHGYISIDPKNTSTEFEGYSIENKSGQIYFGPGHRLHKVNVHSKFDDYRITIGYDITTDPMMDTGCLGLIPLI
jgi:hypothetical protein